jgi:hypothetical protein
MTTTTPAPVVGTASVDPSVSRALSDTVSRSAALVAAAASAAYMEVAQDLAGGRTPQDLPTPHGARGRRLAITATAMARRGTVTPATAEAVWSVYCAAIWATDDADAIAQVDRLELITTPPTPNPWPPTTNDTPPSRYAGVGLVEPGASNAPPARPDSTYLTAPP